MALEPTALLGDWQLTRQLKDDSTGISGTVLGQLTVRPRIEHILWVEQGTLFWNRSRVPVSRSHRLQHTANGWWLYFLDGEPFHPWVPGRWVHHPVLTSEDLA